ncbi:MAG TPA: iron-containing alcohol dehydrogenase [Candidatus Tenderia electrophaga]|uniref:Iron-containing alcohol dehydrogenase n=1 Tax=Candidatus Tenderia electrophaga TaxID=1748243 RepID=A0A832N3D2_9GAMM|nr:iron-containing alcohol dehydrogenase [Candidatus Tenderia electrophaga]
MYFNNFNISRLPRILFGRGRINELAGLISNYGERVLLVTGRSSFQNSRNWENLSQSLAKQNTRWHKVVVSSEPSPPLVDDIVQRHRQLKIELVVAIGGGSVLDAGKAIAGLLPHGNSVMDHLEGVGKGIEYHGPALPFIAAPTTAGTGSEATKNAVLSIHGKQGFKKSFRHDCLVAEYAIIDPDLLQSCPPELMAADGMDAFTQLLESYVSLKANPMIDTLAWSGIEAVKQGFFDAWRGHEPSASDGRAAMAYAALLSGISLAQVGLGSVHGLASPLGAFFPIPHGVVCGTLLAAATEINIRAMQQREPNNPALGKYAQVGRFLSDRPDSNEQQSFDCLVETLNDWTEQLGLQHLSSYGIKASDFDRIVSQSRGSSMLTNPIVLTDDEIGQILQQRL